MPYKVEGIATNPLPYIKNLFFFLQVEMPYKVEGIATYWSLLIQKR